MERIFKATVAVMAVNLMAAAYGESAIFRGGLWKEITYDKPSKEPVFFSGMSRSENAHASNYCIYLDIWYDDGASRSSYAPSRTDLRQTIGDDR